MLKIKPKRTTPYPPRTNRKAERFVPTSLREWADAKPSNHSSERAAALLPFLPNYNHHRPHFGINGRPLSQGPPSITYRDATARVSVLIKRVLVSRCGVL